MINIYSYDVLNSGAAVIMTTFANLIPLIKFYETKNDA
jgi:hypothetical protein